MTDPISTFDTPPHEWHKDAMIRDRLVREDTKIRAYLRKGDLAPVDRDRLERRIHNEEKRAGKMRRVSKSLSV